MAAPSLETTLDNGFNYCQLNANARAAQDLPMGRAKSFPTSFDVLFSHSLHNGRPITPVEQGGNYGGNWILGRNCFPGYPLITDEWGCL